MHGSFNTHDEPHSSTQMAQFLSTVPKPSIILMVVYYQAHDYYTPSSLQSVCPHALSNYTELESWSVICMYGYGTMPWVTSVTSNGNQHEIENTMRLFSYYSINIYIQIFLGTRRLGFS